MKDYRNGILDYFSRLKQTIDLIAVDDFNTLINVLEDARLSGHQIFVMGNGGSAASASHIVCDFNKGISGNKDKRYKVICLNDNVPIMMAYSNDISYNEIFAGQLANFMQPGDVVIGISGSGNSANVVKALEWANANGGITVGLTGFDGGRTMQISRYNVHIPVDDMQITEDLHLVLDHCMMRILC